MDFQNLYAPSTIKAFSLIEELSGRGRELSALCVYLQTSARQRKLIKTGKCPAKQNTRKMRSQDPMTELAIGKPKDILKQQIFLKQYEEAIVRYHKTSRLP